MTVRFNLTVGRATHVKSPIEITSSTPVRVVRNPRFITPGIEGISFAPVRQYHFSEAAFTRTYGAHCEVIGNAMAHTIPTRNLVSGRTVRLNCLWQGRIYRTLLLNDSGTLMFYYDQLFFLNIRSLVYYMIGQYPSFVDGLNWFTDTQGRLANGRYYYCHRSGLSVPRREGCETWEERSGVNAKKAGVFYAPGKKPKKGKKTGIKLEYAVGPGNHVEVVGIMKTAPPIIRPLGPYLNWVNKKGRVLGSFVHLVRR